MLESPLVTHRRARAGVNSVRFELVDTRIPRAVANSTIAKNRGCIIRSPRIAFGLWKAGTIIRTNKPGRRNRSGFTVDSH